MPRTERCAVPGKQYAVIRDFSRVDKFGENVNYKVGDTYSGPVDASYLDPRGPDSKGPLLSEQQPSAPPATSSDSTSKEKS